MILQLLSEAGDFQPPLADRIGESGTPRAVAGWIDWMRRRPCRCALPALNHMFSGLEPPRTDFSTASRHRSGDPPGRSDR